MGPNSEEFCRDGAISLQQIQSGRFEVNVELPPADGDSSALQNGTI